MASSSTLFVSIGDDSDYESSEKDSSHMTTSDQECSQDSENKTSDDNVEFDGDGGIAKEGEALENATPTVARGELRPVPIFVYLVGKGMCPNYQSKQKMKKHLLKVHHYGSVEGVNGRPKGPSSSFRKCTKEQNKRYNTKTCATAAFREAIKDQKARYRTEIKGAKQWEKMSAEMRNFKEPRTISPLARLFCENIEKYFGMSS